MVEFLKIMKLSVRNILLVLFTTSLLVACGEETVDDSGLMRYRGNTFEIRVPASWENIGSDQLVTPIRGTIELAMRSQVSNRGFMNNLTILSDDTYTEATASEYLQQSVVWASKEYLKTTVESQESLEFDDGEKSRLAIYHAKYNEVTEERLFMQTARLCGKRVYLLTL